MRGRWIGVLIALVAWGLIAATAHATFPGHAGKFVFHSRDDEGDFDIFTAEPNGGGRTQVIDNDTQDVYPAWSADGQQIAFPHRPANGVDPDLLVINQDGSGQHQVGPSGLFGTSPSQVAWSPDGSMIAFGRIAAGVSTIHLINTDGTGLQALALGSGPNWSPDGSKIAFQRGGEIWTMNPDGSGAAPLTLGQGEPNWSPDGTRIVFRGAMVNADGTGRVALPCTSSTNTPFWSPDGYFIQADRFTLNADGSNCREEEFHGGSDWQPILAGSGHVRPKGATPVQVSLTPAYVQCTGTNRTHGPPFEEESCAPPAQASERLTVGTFDANGAAADSVGSVRLGVLPGDPSTPAVDEADVSIKASVTDVREQGTLADYEGELGVRASLRIADRDNTSPTAGPDAATTQDGALAFALPCTATADPAGATCELVSTLEALVPGAAKEGQRAVWALGALRVFDGGADGKADTADGDALFMTQGLFIP